MTKIELFKLGDSITLTRTDSVDLRATYRNVSVAADSTLITHAALDTISSLQDKNNNLMRVLDDLLELVELHGGHSYPEYQRAKKLLDSYNEVL